MTEKRPVPDGFINFLKPPGMSSHDAVGFVRRVLGLKKAGHAGTLDPGAAGVLPVAVGRATRLLEYVGGTRKMYRAELRFGTETDSGDDLGSPLGARDDRMPEDEAIEAAVRSLTGVIMQRPPVYSAVKIGGRRACDLARMDAEVEIPPRRVTVHRLTVLERHPEEKTMLIDVACSKGTYIRSICRDIGRAAGVPAAMSFLVRYGVGDFLLEKACTPEELERLGPAAVEPPERYLGHLPRYELPGARVRAFSNGLPTTTAAVFSEDVAIAVFAEGIFLGIGHYDGTAGALVPDKVYAVQSGKERTG